MYLSQLVLLDVVSVDHMLYLFFKQSINCWRSDLLLWGSVGLRLSANHLPIWPSALLSRLLTSKYSLADIHLFSWYFRRELRVVERFSLIKIIPWSLHFSNIIIQLMTLFLDFNKQDKLIQFYLIFLIFFQSIRISS